jgi:DNA ligase (NAD+)
MTEIVCVNNECEGIQLSKLEHFFTTAGVEEFGRPSIESLYRVGYKTILSILEITKEELSSLEGWGESSADTVIAQFKKLKEVGIPFEKLLHALDLFEGVLGEKTAKLALETYDIEYLLSFSFDPIKELYSIKGVSDKTAHAIMKALRFWADNQLGNTLPICIAESRKVGIIGDSCKGMKVCFTGIRDKELEDYITSNGGEIASGVSKTTTHLIVKDMSETTLSSSKAVKAKTLNITIQTINQFKQN